MVGVIAGVVLVAGGVTAGVVVSRKGPARSAGTTTTSTVPTSGTSGAGATTSTSGAPAVPVRVVAVSPANGATSVSGAARIEVSFSAGLSPRSPKPQLSPSEPGSWHAVGNRLVFVPTIPFLPLTNVTLVVPAGASGVRGSDGGHLARPVVDKFTIADGSATRLQQLLSLLDYSPLSFQASGPSIPASDVGAQTAALFDPPAGSFAWRTGGWPTQLTSLWKVGYFGVMTKGLLMEFQADHGLAPNGTTSTALWQALLGALASGKVNTGGYNYALASQTSPESLTIWHDGGVAFHSLANTGISQAPTADGNFNVFARFRNQIMKGTNPGGSTYADPVQYVAYFNGGDAVHYIPRANYGIPQSLGCVELNLADAAKAWPYLAYGTIVTVTS
jgi:peptidoglycan hydrolase-like protein with peptidoglycan-binding domain